MDIIVIVVDALRDDHGPALGPQQWGGDAWLRLGRVYASAPWTLPSCESILTGVPAHVHGRYYHGAPSAERVTLARQLGPAYRSVAVANNTNFSEKVGLLDGFESQRLVPTLEHESVFPLAKKQLADRDGRPTFLFVHTNAVHDYNYPVNREYFRGAYGSDRSWFELGPNVLDWAVPAKARALVPQLYRAGAHWVGAQIRDLIADLDLEQTIVVVTADHGEGMDYDRARIHHGGRVDDDVVRVPLYLHLPARVREQHRDLVEAASRETFAMTELGRLVRVLSGQAEPRELEGRIGDAVPLRTEDRRYVYNHQRLRLNRNTRGKNVRRFDQAKNYVAVRGLVRDFAITALVRYPYKLAVTGFALRDPRIPTAAVARWLLAPEVPVWKQGDLLLGVSCRDLQRDPLEGLSLPSPGWAAFDAREDVRRFEIGGQSLDLEAVLRCYEAETRA